MEDVESIRSNIPDKFVGGDFWVNSDYYKRYEYPSDASMDQTKMVFWKPWERRLSQNVPSKSQ